MAITDQKRRDQARRAKRLLKRGCGRDYGGEDFRTTNSAVNIRLVRSRSIFFVALSSRSMAQHTRKITRLNMITVDLRVMNDDVYRRFDDVMDMILLALEGKLPEL